MARLTIVAGTLVEAQRFTNLPLRFGERDLARERRELWLRGAGGNQSKWIIHTRVLPARRGHRIVLLVRGSRVLGLVNAATGTEVNYVRTDPPYLLRGLDLLAIVWLAIGLPVGLDADGLVLFVPVSVVYITTVVAARLVWRWRLRVHVDRALAEVRRAEVPEGGRGDR